jgi:hypothetical protein
MYNVEVTGAALLYRAASVWTAGLCSLTWEPVRNDMAAREEWGSFFYQEIAPA